MEDKLITASTILLRYGTPLSDTSKAAYNETFWQKYVPGVVVILSITATIVVVFLFMEAYTRRKNRPEDPEEFKICPHCGESIPKLSLECLECRRPVK